MVHIEVGGAWGGRALEVIDRLALPASTEDVIDAEVQDLEEDEPEMPPEVMEAVDELDKDFPPPANVVVGVDPAVDEPSKTGNGRPYAPEDFKEKFSGMLKTMEANFAKKNAEIVVDDVMRKVLASSIDGIFNGEKTMRYTFTRWLCGQASTKKLTPVQVRCLMTVMGVANFGDPPSAVSMTEIRQAHTFALKSEGQQELLEEPK